MCKPPISMKTLEIGAFFGGLCEKRSIFDIKGVLAPVFTPMDDEGQINYDVIPEYMQYLTDSNIRGILVGGTTGEAASLSVAERKLLLKAWIDAARPLGVKVISQVGGAPLPYVIELAKYSEEVKADAIMTLPELYFKPKTAEMLVVYLELVSKAAPSLPLIYYHFPMMSGVDMGMRDFYNMAKNQIPNFKGMKADLAVALQVADSLDSDHRIFMANHHLAPAALMGYHSSIATVTNLFPSFIKDLVQSMEGTVDVEYVRQQQLRLNCIVDDIASHGDFVPSMKVAMAAVSGVKLGPPRQPLTRLNKTGEQLINILIKEHWMDKF